MPMHNWKKRTVLAEVSGRMGYMDTAWNLGKRWDIWTSIYLGHDCIQCLTHVRLKFFESWFTATVNIPIISTHSTHLPFLSAPSLLSVHIQELIRIPTFRFTCSKNKKFDGFCASEGMFILNKLLDKCHMISNCCQLQNTSVRTLNQRVGKRVTNVKAVCVYKGTWLPVLRGFPGRLV